MHKIYSSCSRYSWSCVPGDIGLCYGENTSAGGAGVWLDDHCSWCVFPETGDILPKNGMENVIMGIDSRKINARLVRILRAGGNLAAVVCPAGTHTR